MPYPVLLVATQGEYAHLSLAHKRWAQNEAGKVVIDGGVVSTSLSGAIPSAQADLAFIQSLSLTRQPQATLLALYQGWMDCVQALRAARLPGTYRITERPEQTAARRQTLLDCERLQAEINRLRAQAAKEKQIARQVELNLTLKQLNNQLDQARSHL